MIYYFYRKHTYTECSCLLIRTFIWKGGQCCKKPCSNLISEIECIYLKIILFKKFMKQFRRKMCRPFSWIWNSFSKQRDLSKSRKKTCISLSYTLDVFLLNFLSSLRQKMYIYLGIVLFFALFISVYSIVNKKIN